MEELYLKLQELLKQIPQLRYIDLDTGQLMMEQPPISYPAALIEIDLASSEDIGANIQHCNVNFVIRLVTKAIGETNANAPAPVIKSSLEWLRLQNEVYKKLQGYGDAAFYPFSRRSGKNEVTRIGLKTFALRFETSFHDHSASS